MNTPFALPEGVTWREVDDCDRDWWSRTSNVPVDQLAALKVEYRLRDLRSGEERTIVERWIPFKMTDERDETLHHIAYALTQGSPGCGCNRRLFWARAANEPEPDDPQCEAQHEIVWPQWLAEADAAFWDFEVPRSTPLS